MRPSPERRRALSSYDDLLDDAAAAAAAARGITINPALFILLARYSRGGF
jgi:hypothetical protein